LVVSRFQY